MTDLYRETILNLRSKLQEEYDLICSMMIECYIKDQRAGYNEYLWRKHEIEQVSERLGIELLKERKNEKLLEIAESKKQGKSIGEIASENFVKLADEECEKFGIFDKFKEAHKILKEHEVKDDWGNGTKKDPYIILIIKNSPLEKYIFENYKVDKNNIIYDNKTYYKILICGGEE